MSLLCNVIKKTDISVNFQLCLIVLSRVFAAHSDWLNVLWHALCCLVYVLVYSSIYPSPLLTIAFPSVLFPRFFHLYNWVSSLLGVRHLFLRFLPVTCASFICMLRFHYFGLRNIHRQPLPPDPWTLGLVPLSQNLKR
jgi:hypothetical protein